MRPRESLIIYFPCAGAPAAAVCTGAFGSFFTFWSAVAYGSLPSAASFARSSIACVDRKTDGSGVAIDVAIRPELAVLARVEVADVVPDGKHHLLVELLFVNVIEVELHAGDDYHQHHYGDDQKDGDTPRIDFAGVKPGIVRLDRSDFF